MSEFTPGRQARSLALLESDSMKDVERNEGTESPKFEQVDSFSASDNDSEGEIDSTLKAKRGPSNVKYAGA